LSGSVPTLTLVAEQCLASVPGGTGRYTTQIGAALAADRPAGWTVRSVTGWHRDLSAARIAGIDGPRRLPAGRRALTWLWERGLPPWPEADSIHACTPLAPARRSAPLVAVIHDLVPWTHPETITPRGVRWHRRAIAALERHADAVIVPSRAVAGDLERIYAFADRVHVVPHGVTTSVVSEADRDDEAVELPDDYLLTVATLEPRKGLDVLVRALAEPGMSQQHLVVVGQPGWGGLDLDAAARRAALDPARVHVLGRIRDGQLATAYRRAAIVVVPSRAEGFGLPLLEGMAAGKPVVYSDIPALRELAGGTGIMVPADDPASLARAVLQARAPGVSGELGSTAKRRAGMFSWHAAALATWRVHLGVS